MLPIVLLAAVAPAEPPARAEGSLRRFHHTEHTTAPPDAIWSLWMDVARWPTWDTELASASAGRPLELGATGTIVSDGRSSRFEVVTFEPDRRYAYAVRLPAVDSSSIAASSRSPTAARASPTRCRCGASGAGCSRPPWGDASARPSRA